MGIRNLWRHVVSSSTTNFQGLGIPIVTLLLEGGIDAIRIIKERLREGIAAVVIEGSGRAADIIAYAYKNATKTSKS